MPGGDLPDRFLTAGGGKIHDEDHPRGPAVMSDFACFAGSVLLFALAALYARARGDI